MPLELRVAELAGAVLITLLFELLSRSQRTRTYFATWVYFWLLLVIASAGLVAQAIAGGRTAGDDGALRIIAFIYDLGTLAAYVPLAMGVKRYVNGTGTRAATAVLLLIALVYSIVSMLVARNFSELVTWQSPVAVVALSACVLYMLRLTASRQSLGSVTTLAGLILGLLFHTIVLSVMVASTAMDPRRVTAILGALYPYGTYAEALMYVLLACGMTIILLEDARREADRARAELAAAHDQLKTSAFYDTLTGALNRRAFSHGVGIEASRDGAGTVVMLDLDNLKGVNDRHGHEAGDDLLRRLVSTLRTALGPADRLYRWGGDEFLILMPDCSPTEAEPRLDALFAEGANLSRAESVERAALLVSLGAAFFDGAASVQDAITAADREMYRRKGWRQARSEREGAAPNR